MAEDKVKNFITVFDETINNCDKINTPEEITKTFESLQRVTDELLTENNLVIDHNTLVRYNNFLANEAVVSCITELKIDKNFFDYSSYPSCFDGKSEEEILNIVKYIQTIKIFGCLRGFLGAIAWNDLNNSIEEWATKELNYENSITNHVIKYFKLLKSFYKLLYNLNESFLKKDEGYDERAEMTNIIKIQARIVMSLREGIFILSISNSKYKEIEELTNKAVDELSNFPLEQFLVKHYFN